MLSFLEKYNQLPYELREKVSSPEAMQIIAGLEGKYGVNLAIAVMRVMVKDILLSDLAKFFIFECELDAARAAELAVELKAKFFIRVANYLELAAAGAPVANIGAAAESPVPAEKRAVSPSGTGANFFFSPEDEEEVRALGAKVEGFQNGSGAAPDFSGMIAVILSKVGVSLSSAELNNRLKQVMHTYLKGVRGRVDAKQTLLKPVTEGGLGLDLNTAERLIFTADQAKEEGNSAKPLRAPPKIRVPEDELAAKFNITELAPVTGKDQAGMVAVKPAGAGLGRDIPYDFSRFKAAAQPATVAGPAAVSDQRENTAIATAVKDRVSVAVDSLAVKSHDFPGSKVSVIAGENLKVASEVTAGPEPAAPLSVRRPTYAASPTVAAGKFRMDDVKYVPKLTGPVDELREMDLINFRRLSRDPLSAVTKIKEKINALEDENYSQRLAGIKAWRESPANKLYLAVGQESISQGRSVGEIIAWHRGGAGVRTATRLWLDSAPHRALILRPGFRYAGAGWATGRRRTLWTVRFGSR